jgi:hypothetical protein
MNSTLATRLLAITGAALASACANHAHQVDLVKQRAPFDLQCPEKDLKVEGLGPHVFGASGCGSQASYVLEHCNGWRSSCRAILDSGELAQRK